MALLIIFSSQISKWRHRRHSVEDFWRRGGYIWDVYGLLRFWLASHEGVFSGARFSSLCGEGWKTIIGDPGAVSRAGRKGVTKVFKHRQKSPWVPTVTGPFPNGQANAGSWLGTKNALYYCAQSANSISRVLFVSSYTTAIISPQLPGSFIKLS